MNVKIYGKTLDFYLLFFFFSSFLGWLWEVVLTLFSRHEFINRGILFGPWLPIYGFGGCFLVLLLQNLKKHPVLIFLISLLLCSVLEYFSGLLLETLWNVKWWDYSEHAWNLHGRICLLCSIGFGIGGLLILYVILPLFERLYDRIPQKAALIVSLILLLFLAADAAYAADIPNMGRGISEPAGKFRLLNFPLFSLK